ncbi:hypothetical protein [Acetobacter aceti]|uniref:Uncharacterized protein n=1 Tax=Acetobacter aceti TaxID=435 RepID=A0A6S6PL22_ACEAC|nr:hypothetical protein [Acetobacter aceti]BCI68043.1 hypothetical protein AAJCM20276_26670 [Acetobacter aceti]
MFYAVLTNGSVETKAFNTEAEAAQWIVDELGTDYADDFWVENGKLKQSSACLDFTAAVFPSEEEAEEFLGNDE